MKTLRNHYITALVVAGVIAYVVFLYTSFDFQTVGK